MGSKIEWTEETWNPVTGCSKISIGCKNCYAERMSMRLQAMGMKRYTDGFKVHIHPDILYYPIEKWKKPRVVFVNSMSDLFHRNVPTDFIIAVFSVMSQASQHTFQVLTKRPERALRLKDKLEWSDNIWMGTSVENNNYRNRINILSKLPAKIRFLSLEPLLGPIPNIPLKKIDWVIIGGESGPKSRLMKPEWAIGIRDQCIAKEVPFFFKQWGTVNKKKAGRILEGRVWDEMPTPC